MRRLVLLSAVLITAMAAITFTTSSVAPPTPQPVAAVRAAPPLYAGPTTDRHQELVRAVQAAHDDAVVRWYAEAKRQEDERAAAQEAARKRATRKVSASPSSSSATVADGDRFDRLASCESGDGHGSINPQAVSPGGKYRGAFQFSLSTWQNSVHRSGDPIDYTYADQKAAAMELASISTPSSQWPVCWARSA